MAKGGIGQSDEVGNYQWETYSNPSSSLPDRFLPDPASIRVGDQGEEACGLAFALATIVNLHRAKSGLFQPVSPRMLYENGRRYDPWHESAHEGSSLEAVCEGFRRHGVCLESEWPFVEQVERPYLPLTPPPEVGDKTQPIHPTAIERISKNRDHIKAAIVELGAAYVGLETHKGWDSAVDGEIQPAEDKSIVGGTGVAVIGYTEDGFLVQNSWGPAWGGAKIDGKQLPGVALLPYRDFDQSMQDAWAIRMEPSSPPRAGFDADEIDRDDCLDIMPDVRAIASVISARDVHPPIAVGLFGDWGTGKSFFMKKLQGHVAHLADLSNNASGEAAYCTKVVQIPFNAWHFLDADLWASLVSEIFSKLFEKIDATEKQTRPQIEAKLGEAHGLFRESQMQLDNARQAQVQAEATHAKTRADLENHEAGIRELGDQLLELISSDEKLVEGIKQMAKDTGVDNLAESFGALKEEAGRGDTSRLVVTVKKFLDPKGRRTRLLLLAGFLVAGFLVAWIPSTIESLDVTWLNEWMATASAAVLWAVDQFRRGNGSVMRARELLDRVNQVRDPMVKEKLKRANAELDECRQEVKEAEEHAIVAKERVSKLEDEPRDVDPRRQLFRFIDERHKSDDYKNALGLVTLVRRDFESLSKLMAESERMERSGDADRDERAHDDPPMPVQRIVLYIDDLDRCKPERVVEVLECVHLLLAFRLFVVVVAVDPRWLRRCLEKHYPELLTTYETIEPDDKENRLRRASTPQDYLEKIFQLPFYLRPISEGGYQRMIDDLAGHDVMAEEEDRSDDDKSDVGGGGTVGVGPTRGKAGWSDLVGGSRVQPQVELDPKQLQFKRHEFDNMKKLAVLFQTPRAAKRFVNTYRLVRVGVPAHELADFEGANATSGDHRVAMTLLAVVAGCPNVAPRFLRRLIDPSGVLPPSMTWSQFLDVCCFSDVAASEPDAEAATQADANEGGEQEESAGERELAGETNEPDSPAKTPQEDWSKLGSRLVRVTELGFLPEDLESFQRWAPRVARYSFSVTLPSAS